MSAFSFSTVPHLVSQPGAAAELGQHVSTHFPNTRRALIVTDPGFLRTGLIDAPARDLEKHKLAVHIYSDVVADPPEHVVLKAVEFARRHEIDLVIGFGGGSSMDVAKLIAVLAG
ncbi:MAG: alcohol dehydrogenase, partial [Massilia sp.]|nr:alcohol dehydrogenase [Massilia sp.]